MSDDPGRMLPNKRRRKPAIYEDSASTGDGGVLAFRDKPLAATKAPARNAPCPCGSTKKYKKCCGDPRKEVSNET